MPGLSAVRSRLHFRHVDALPPLRARALAFPPLPSKSTVYVCELLASPFFSRLPIFRTFSFLIPLARCLDSTSSNKDRLNDIFQRGARILHCFNFNHFSFFSFHGNTAVPMFDSTEEKSRLGFPSRRILISRITLKCLREYREYPSRGGFTNKRVIIRFPRQRKKRKKMKFSSPFCPSSFSLFFFSPTEITMPRLYLIASLCRLYPFVTE